MDLQKLTDKQREVVETLDKNIIVSASAGSGKTTVMIKKIVYYMEQKNIPIDEMLVLTYTKSAAQEMKQRLVNTLKEELDEYPNLQEQLENVGSADICTIDSFCQKFVKKYFYALNIDAGFNIIDNQEQTYLKSKAIEKTLSNYKKTNEQDYLLLLDVLSSNRTDSKIKETIFEIYNFKTAIISGEEFDKKTLELYNKNGFAVDYITSELNQRLIAFENRFNSLAIKSKELGCDKYVEHINLIQSQISCLKNLKTIGEKISFYNTMSTPNLNFDKENDGISFVEIIKKSKKSFKTFLDKMCEHFIDDKHIENAFETSKALASILLWLCNEFTNNYKKEKQKINGYDFADIEKMMLSLLSSPKICEEIALNYKQIFVDEFQDANQIQYEILQRIKTHSNIFYVGDFKQAIYGFRLSNPKLFLQVEQELKCDSNNNLATSLNANFRTDKNVLDFVNNVFDILMTKQFSSIDYKENSRLWGLAPYKDAKIKSVQLDILYKDNKKIKDKPPQIYSVQSHMNSNEEDNLKILEARHIAEIITNCIGKEIYDTKLDSYRKVNYSDITILLRKRGDFQGILAKTFSEYHIPLLVNLNEKLDETYDGNVFYNALKYAFNKKDDFALTGILSSPLFNFSDSELAEIKIIGEQKTFYDCFVNYKKYCEDIYQKNNINLYEKNIEINTFKKYEINIKNNLENNILNSKEISKINEINTNENNYNKNIENLKINEKTIKISEITLKKVLLFEKTINSFVFNIKNYGICVALNNLINETNYIFNIRNDVNFISRKQNIKAYISKFSGSNFEYDLPKYLRYRNADIGDTESTNLVEENNCVSITTMHSSKGLEYPIVILANLSDDFTKSPKFSDIALNNEIGLGVKCFNKNSRVKYNGIFYQTIEDINKNESTGESLRLLYVAMTRAKNHLFLTGATNNLDFDEIDGNSVIYCNSYLKMIVGTFDDLGRINILNKNQFNPFGNTNFVCKVIEPSEGTSLYPKNEVFNFDIDEKSFVAINDFLSKNTKTINDNFAVKNSVSSISFSEDLGLVDYAPKSLNVSEHLNEYNSTELGTEYHLALEKTDFNLVNEKQDLVKILYENNLLNNINSEENAVKLERLYNIIIEIKKVLPKKYVALKEQKFVSNLDLFECKLADCPTGQKILVQGAMDFVAVGDGKVVLIDYKLSNLNKESLLKKYEKQLYLYALALKKQFPKKSIEVYLASIKRGGIYRVEM